MTLTFSVLILAMLAAGPMSRGEATVVTDPKFEQDRKAILAMAGEYRVTFQFEETVGFAADYKLHEPHNSVATEFVEVIEDRGDFISLQHVLVLKKEKTGEPYVVKHWRQDWQYQDTQLSEYRGRRVWEHVTLTPEQVAGAWSQAVYQVDDSPRYEAIGRWTHMGDRSAWESGDAWRPLPRREHTQRKDYDVLVGRNRHTLTPTGWVHEQDNYKLVLDEEGKPKNVLAHEAGLNLYDRVNDVDFTAGRDYWRDTQAYWHDVRKIWTQILDQPGRVTIQVKVDDELLHEALFELANEVREQGGYDATEMLPRIEQTISKHMTLPTGQPTAAKNY